MALYFAKVWSAQTIGLSAHLVSVEADISKNTLQKFTLVGLPDKAVAESRDRVSAALKNSGFSSPKQINAKVVVSLAPADIKKEGPVFDLAIALAYLKAFEEITFDSTGRIFLGELSLLGDLHPIRGVLALVLEAKRLGFHEIFLPKDNAAEAALIDGVSVFGAVTLSEVIDHINEKNSGNGILSEDRGDVRVKPDRMQLKRTLIVPTPKTKITHREPLGIVSLEDIKGQETAKRGLTIAAAGGHNIALVGPPGTGKTMLARALRTILPPLSFDESVEVTAIHSIAGTLREPIIMHPPFRSPHHTASYVSLVGGGPSPKPGEATLAHRGVLFCDEFLEFDRRVIEALREPMEEGVINISRAKGSACFPANFILVAAMNPCPCGYFGSHRECVCLPLSQIRYQRRLSGPIMDRIDLWVEVSHVPHDGLLDASPGGETKRVRRAVRNARGSQSRRFNAFFHSRKSSILAGTNLRLNGSMSARELQRTIILEHDAKRALQDAARSLDLSPRTYHRLVKTARTIADLEGCDTVLKIHIMEALQYRPKQHIS